MNNTHFSFSYLKYALESLSGQKRTILSICSEHFFLINGTSTLHIQSQRIYQCMHLKARELQVNKKKKKDLFSQSVIQPFNDFKVRPISSPLSHKIQYSCQVNFLVGYLFSSVLYLWAGQAQDLSLLEREMKDRLL